jgi:hypothetical protein
MKYILLIQCREGNKIKTGWAKHVARFLKRSKYEPGNQ